MSDQVVNTVFKAKDKISNVFKNMGRNNSKFSDGVEKGFKKASRSANRFKDITKGILTAGAISKGLSAIARAGTETTRTFISFDDALFSASAKFNDVNLATKEGRALFKRLGDSAREVGAKTQFNAKQAAEGLDFLALAGFNAEQAMAALPKLSDLATAAGVEDFGRVVDIASDSLGAFGLATKDATQLAKNLERVSDSFAKTQASTNTTVEDLFEAVGKGAPQFTAASQSIETFNALAGVLANSSVKGAEAGTQLRNIMLRLASPTKQSSKLINGLGVNIKDAQGNFRNAIDIIGDFEKGLKGMGSVQRSATLATIFGARSVTGMNILLKEGAVRLKEWEKGQMAAAGTSKDMANIMRQSLGNRIKSLFSALDEFGFKILDAFKSKGVNALDVFTNALRTVDVKPIISGIKTSIEIFKDLMTVIKSATIILSPLIAATLAYKTAIIATAAGTKAIVAITAAYRILRSGTVIATAVQWAFNAAMSANPIGLIIGGVALLGTAIFILVKNWETVKKAFIDGGNAILRIFTRIWEMAKNITFGGISAIGNLFGGDEKEKGQGFTPPNQKEAENNAQTFSGVLRFENKPDNVTFESQSRGAPLINIAGLGTN